MPKLMPRQIKDEVYNVISKAKKGKGRSPHFLTAYQILGRLSKTTRNRLISERGGAGGRGQRRWDSAARIVAQAGVSLAREKRIEISYIDTTDLSISIKNLATIKPGFQVCGLYRVKVKRIASANRI